MINNQNADRKHKIKLIDKLTKSPQFNRYNKYKIRISMYIVWNQNENNRKYLSQPKIKKDEVRVQSQDFTQFWIPGSNKGFWGINAGNIKKN